MSLAVIVAVILPFMLPELSCAVIKTYTHRVVQSFGGSQSPDDARIAALARAKFEVLEKAGTYLESYTVVLDGVVAQDAIWALASGILKAEVVSEKRFATADAFGIVVEAKVDIDTTVIEQRVQFMLENRNLLAKLHELQQREKQLLQRIEKLEGQNQILEQTLRANHGGNLPPLKPPGGGLQSLGNMTPERLRYYVHGMAFEATRQLEAIAVEKTELFGQLPWQ